SASRSRLLINCSKALLLMSYSCCLSCCSWPAISGARSASETVVPLIVATCSRAAEDMASSQRTVVGTTQRTSSKTADRHLVVCLRPTESVLRVNRPAIYSPFMGICLESLVEDQDIHTHVVGR